MEDAGLTDLDNICADLVSMKRWEAFPAHLLMDKRAGEWVGVREFCLQAELDAENLKPDLFATWLADPTGDEAYAVILFYDEESMWTKAALCNRQWFLEGAPRITGEIGKCHAAEQSRPAHAGQPGRS